MQLQQIDPSRCTGCGACEFSCGLYHDRLLTSFRSSIILYREERRNYYGPLIRIKQDIILGRPEGVALASQLGKLAPAGKPILLRPECDDCAGRYLCAKLCPTGAIRA